MFEVQEFPVQTASDWELPGRIIIVQRLGPRRGPYHSL